MCGFCPGLTFVTLLRWGYHFSPAAIEQDVFFQRFRIGILTGLQQINEDGQNQSGLIKAQSFEDCLQLSQVCSILYTVRVELIFN